MHEAGQLWSPATGSADSPRRNQALLETGKLESPSTAMAHGGDGGACVAGIRRSGTFWRSRWYEAGFGGNRIPDGLYSLYRY